MSPARIAENLRDLAREIPAASFRSRARPDLELVRGWHRRMCLGADVPDDAYRGGFRGDAHMALRDYESTVGGLRTVPAVQVAAQLDEFIDELGRRLETLDEFDDLLDDDLSEAFVQQALECAAWQHGEWIRIHPFVNGNGRTARMWVLWLCARYGLPPLLRLSPRPDLGYTPASTLSLMGDHRLLLQYLLLQYNALD